MDVRGDTLVYLRSFRDLVKQFTVKLRNVKGVFIKKILMVSESSHVWHLSFETLNSLKHCEVDYVLRLIERNNENAKSLYDELRNSQPVRLPKVFTKPRTITY